MDISDEKLKEYAKEINDCFDNGCGCCYPGRDSDKHKWSEAIHILRVLIELAKREV